MAFLSSGGCGLDEEAAEFSMLGREPESLDPALCTGQPGGRILLNIFEGLTTREPKTLRPIPGAAESWERSEDGRVYTFHLREDARWSDGHPLTSEDFRYAWTRLLDPRTAAPYANLLYPVQGAIAFHRGENDDPESLGLECPDELTFVVRLETPVAYWLDLCAYYAFLPVPRWAVEEHGAEWTRPGHLVSNGPYYLEQWQINRRVRLRRNPEYWDRARVAVASVDVIHSDDVNAAFNRYESGGLDWVDSEGVPLTVVEQLLAREDMHVGPYLNTYFLRFGVLQEPMQDPRVRKAFYHAVKPSDITEHVLRAGQIPAHSLVPPGLPGYEEVRLGGYDPELARAYLAEAGYPGGEGFPEVTYLYNTSEGHRAIAQVLQQQWKRELGVEVRLRNMEWRVFMAETRTTEYQIARGGWIGDYLDPNTFLELFASGDGNNRTGWSHAGYDSLLRTAARELEPARRMGLLRECEEILLQEECVVLPLYYYVVTNLYDATRWEGLELDLLNFPQLKYLRPTDEES